MYKYKTFDGIKYKFDFCCIPEGDKITYFIEAPFYKEVTSKLYYREYKTLNDYMGNTEAGYYVVANLNGHKHRIYI